MRFAFISDIHGNFHALEVVLADLQHAQGTCNIEWAVSDVSRMLEVTKGLVARGFSDNEVRKILGENYLRIYRRVVGA